MNIEFKNKGISVLISAFLLLFHLSVEAQFTETRDFMKRFKVLAETRIDITNKYGKIELNTWNKDSVVIQFHMEVNEKKPDKLMKSLEKLDFDISNSPYYLTVKTQVDKTRSPIESELLKFKETMLQTNGSIRIDLVVWLPDNHELRLESKFGDIIMGDYQGETQINLSNGKLKAGDLPKNNSLNLSFADANINKLTNARIICNYSDILIKNSVDLRFESKSSNIEVQNSGDLSIDSRRDKYRILIADKIDASGNFSHFRISEFRNKANLRLSYGSLDMEKILNSFTDIYLETRSADINLYFNPEAKFNFLITEIKTDLKLGRELKVEDKEVLDPKENKVRHSGYFGKKMQEDQLIINAIGGETNVLSY
jgi:hypothetical protein